MSNLWEASIELMLMGMGTVFVFLILLVIATTIMSYIINKITQRQLSAATSSEPTPAEIAAVAAAAFNRHKK